MMIGPVRYSARSTHARANITAGPRIQLITSDEAMSLRSSVTASSLP
jgi:hypothetical protein